MFDRNECTRVNKSLKYTNLTQKSLFEKTKYNMIIIIIIIIVQMNDWVISLRKFYWACVFEKGWSLKLPFIKILGTYTRMSSFDDADHHGLIRIASKF